MVSESIKRRAHDCAGVEVPIEFPFDFPRSYRASFFIVEKSHLPQSTVRTEIERDSNVHLFPSASLSAPIAWKSEWIDCKMKFALHDTISPDFDENRPRAVRRSGKLPPSFVVVAPRPAFLFSTPIVSRRPSGARKKGKSAFSHRVREVCLNGGPFHEKVSIASKEFSIEWRKYLAPSITRKSGCDGRSVKIRMKLRCCKPREIRLEHMRDAASTKDFPNERRACAAPFSEHDAFPSGRKHPWNEFYFRACWPFCVPAKSKGNLYLFRSFGGEQCACEIWIKNRYWMNRRSERRWTDPFKDSDEKFLRKIKIPSHETLKTLVAFSPFAAFSPMYGESTSRRIPHRIQEKFFLTGAHETHSKFACRKRFQIRVARTFPNSGTHETRPLGVGAGCGLSSCCRCKWNCHSGRDRLFCIRFQYKHLFLAESLKLRPSPVRPNEFLFYFNEKWNRIQQNRTVCSGQSLGALWNDFPCSRGGSPSPSKGNLDDGCFSDTFSTHIGHETSEAKRERKFRRRRLIKNISVCMCAQLSWRRGFLCVVGGRESMITWSAWHALFEGIFLSSPLRYLSVSHVVPIIHTCNWIRKPPFAASGAARVSTPHRESLIAFIL